MSVCVDLSRFSGFFDAYLGGWSLFEPRHSETERVLGFLRGVSESFLIFIGLSDAKKEND